MQAHNNGDYGSDARAIDVDDESSSCSFIDYFLLHRNHWRKLVKNIGGEPKYLGLRVAITDEIINHFSISVELLWGTCPICPLKSTHIYDHDNLVQLCCQFLEL